MVSLLSTSYKSQPIHIQTNTPILQAGLLNLLTFGIFVYFFIFIYYSAVLFCFAWDLMSGYLKLGALDSAVVPAEPRCGTLNGS
jgi:hypothetical protein